MRTDRRQFLRATASAFAALSAAGCAARGGSVAVGPGGGGYGALVPDPDGLLDLPRGFSYRVVSALGDLMSDGDNVPDRADGMGCFDLGNGEWALVRNHELRESHGPGPDRGPGFARGEDGSYLPGGTTTIVLDARTLDVKEQFRSLLGTHNNCAGGVTPWGSWLSCEEGIQGRPVRDGHGWVFEVPAAHRGIVDPVPLKSMGRFMHEAACVDPASGYVYMTEDRPDGLLYRFIPIEPGNLAAGGQLQVLAIDGIPDTTNHDETSLRPGERHICRWLDIDNPEAPADDLRHRGAALGASIFARGEGLWMGEGEFYFTATSGGAISEGQVFRITLGSEVDVIDLFFESDDRGSFTYPDNITIAPNGELIVCEDQYRRGAVNHVRGITASGEVYPFAALRLETELAGACFSPDGRTLFVNAYSPTRTLAITGPWKWLAG